MLQCLDRHIENALGVAKNGDILGKVLLDFYLLMNSVLDFRPQRLRKYNLNSKQILTESENMTNKILTG